MKKLLTVIPLVFLLCFFVGCKQPAEETVEEAVTEVVALSDEDVAAIKAATEVFSQVVNSEDLTALAELYTEDAVLMPPNTPMIRGREAIQAWHEASPPTTEFSLTTIEIDGRGDLAFVLGTFSLTIEVEGAQEPIHDTGKYLEIRVKQQDGSWPLSRLIFNSDLPLPPPPEKE